MLEKVVRRTSNILAIISSTAIVVMVVAIATDVVVRNLTGASVPGMIELAETAMVASVAFGLAWAGVQGEHVAVTLLTDRFGMKVKQTVNIVVWTLSSGYLLWLVFANLLRSIESTVMREERFGIIRWPVYPMRWILLVGFIALLLVCLVNLVRSVKGSSPMGFSDEIDAALA